MATTTLQSNLVPFQVSADAGVTYKNLVCKKSWKFASDTPITNEDTDCGRLIGVGVFAATIGFEVILNSTPVGGTEVSVNDMLGFAANQTLLWVRIMYPTPAVGTTLAISGQAYITKFDIDDKVGSLITATGTVSFTGAVRVIP